MEANNRGKRSRWAALNLDVDDNNFVEVATNAKTRSVAMKRLVSSRRSYIVMTVLCMLAVIMSIFSENPNGIVLALLVLALCRFSDVDIKIKVLKTLERIELERGKVDL